MFSLVFLPMRKLELYKVKYMLEENTSTNAGKRQEVSSILPPQLVFNGNFKFCSIYFLVLIWFQVACVGLLIHGIFTASSRCLPTDYISISQTSTSTNMCDSLYIPMPVPLPSPTCLSICPCPMNIRNTWWRWRMILLKMEHEISWGVLCCWAIWTQ